MTCAQMGGPACDTMISGSTAEEMATSGMAHVTEAHADMAADIKKMTSEETTHWMADFQKKFDAAPEM